MGKTILNTALATLSGKIDAWVYRRRAGRVMVAKKPDFTEVVPSARQLALRERFLKAIEYGKAVNNDSVRREPYAKAAEGTLSTAFAKAVGDFLGLPVVKELDLTAYTGHIGSTVKVDAKDDFEVVAVKVTIRDAATGDNVEQGQAVLREGWWYYTATTEAPRDRTLTVEAEAYDRAGNSRTLEDSWGPIEP